MIPDIQGYFWPVFTCPNTNRSEMEAAILYKWDMDQNYEFNHRITTCEDNYNKNLK